MTQFKIGDKVVCVRSQVANGSFMDEGYEGVITHISQYGAVAVDNMLGVGGVPVMSQTAFEKMVKKSSGEIKAKRKSKLYGVAHKDNIQAGGFVEDGDIEFISRNRDEAREVKADFGGRKKGYELLQFSFEKIIR